MVECKQATGWGSGRTRERIAGGKTATGFSETGEARDIFLANISHELRTPLNGVLGMAELLERTELTTTQRGMLHDLRESGETLARMLADLLDQTEIGSGQITVRSEPFSLGETVRTAVEQAERGAALKGVGFRALIEPSAEQTVMGDACRLKQIVASLTDNAVKFTDRGAVSVSARVDNDGVCRIVVSDTGPGLHPEIEADTFDAFRQGDSSSTRGQGGLGLGLALARQRADLIGAGLECRSVPGKGSAFILTIPVAHTPPSSADHPAPVEGLVGRSAIASEPGELSVLVVDDHRVNRELLKLTLMPSGARVVTAENGAEACELWTADRFDLVVMDLQMPVMDGLTAIRRIRTAEKSHGSGRTPIVVFTANATNEQERASFSAGADHFLTKPLAPSVLMVAFQKILQQCRPQPVGALGATH